MELFPHNGFHISAETNIVIANKSNLDWLSINKNKKFFLYLSALIRFF